MTRHTLLPAMAALFLFTAEASLAQDRAPAPEGAEEGELVEGDDGELYEVRDGVLVPLDEALEEPAPESPAGEDSADEQPAAAAADDDEDTDRIGEVTVTGSRVDTRVGETVVRTDSVSNEQIQERGATNLAEALGQEAGIQVNSSVGTGQQVQIDGLDGKYVLILVDGRPVNGRTNDRVDITRLPVTPSNIERIEVVRGPMSALYGSEAIGGVVNIITKRPEPGLRGEVVAGGTLTHGGPWQSVLGAHLEGSAGPAIFKIDANGMRQELYDRAQKDISGDDPDGSFPPPNFIWKAPDGRADLPARRQGSLSGEVSTFVGDDWETKVYGMTRTQDVTTRTNGAVPFREHTSEKQFQVGSQIIGEPALGQELSADIRADQYQHVFSRLPDGGAKNPPDYCRDSKEAALRFFDPPCPAPPQYKTDATQNQSRLELRYTGLWLAGLPGVAELTGSVGAVTIGETNNRLNGDGEDTLPGGGELYRAAIYAELLYRPFTFLSLIPGFRIDGWTPGPDGFTADASEVRYDDYISDPPFGPRLSTRLDLFFGFALRASYGRGYRLPSFQERSLRFDHSELGYVVEGNNTLRPESSHGLRAEALWQKAGWGDVGAELYMNLLRNQISPLPRAGNPIDDETGAPVFTYGNIARSYTSGLNLRASSGEFWGFSGSAGYQYVFNAVDASECPEDDDAFLFDVNSYFCTAEEGANTLPFTADHSVQVDGRYRIKSTGTKLFAIGNFLSERPIGFGVRASPFLLLSVGVHQQIWDNADLLVTAVNLLDQYDPIFGPKPGMHVRSMLRLRF